MKRIDANVILRYLLDDHEVLSEKATAIFRNESLFASFEVLCEVVYVLEGVYHVTRPEIDENIRHLFECHDIGTNDLSVLLYAMSLFSGQKIDFVDSILCAYHAKHGDEIITFDKKIINQTKSK